MGRVLDRKDINRDKERQKIQTETRRDKKEKIRDKQRQKYTNRDKKRLEETRRDNQITFSLTAIWDGL